CRRAAQAAPRPCRWTSAWLSSSSPSSAPWPRRPACACSRTRAASSAATGPDPPEPPPPHAMTATTLISAAELVTALRAPTPPVVLDCSGDLSDPEAGRRAYAAGHIPGALHVPMHETLSGPRTGDNGR